MSKPTILAVDIGPTILDLAGLPQPTHVEGITQTPMHGTSFLHTFADPAAEERRTQQYFEIFGYRAMYKDGWWLAQGDLAHPMGPDASNHNEARPRGMAARPRPGGAVLPAG